MAENQNIEWKESWRDEYLKWVCGFANAQGGKIYIGKDDQGAVTGISNSKRLLEDIPNKVRDILGILIDVNLHTEQGRDYIEIANTFFRAGFIEAWGRGIEKIKSSCEEAGNPLPEYTVKREDIMVVFKNSISKVGGNGGKIGGNYGGDTFTENEKKVLEQIQIEPSKSITQISLDAKIPKRTVERVLQTLKSKGIIQRDGSSRKGVWIIIKK